MLSVLLNVAFVVRHGATMIETHFQHASLASALGIICKGGSSEAALPEDQRSSIPSPTAGSDCPACMGGCPTAAILPDPLNVAGPVCQTSERVAVVGQIIWARIAYLRPPSRGPPAIV